MTVKTIELIVNESYDIKYLIIMMDDGTGIICNSGTYVIWDLINTIDSLGVEIFESSGKLQLKNEKRNIAWETIEWKKMTRNFNKSRMIKICEGADIISVSTDDGNYYGFVRDHKLLVRSVINDLTRYMNGESRK